MSTTPAATTGTLSNPSQVIDIRDIKGPVTFPWIMGYVIAAILLVALITGAIAGLRFFFRKYRKAAPPKKPHEVAYEALDALRGKDWIKKGKFKEFFYTLSSIVRTYVENRFNIHALEMTTEEFLLKAKDADELSRGHKELLKEFLSKCDLVKYAPYGPSANEVESAIELAIRFVDQTKPQEPVELATP
ncbi:MAG: hypothetical protein PHS37_06765 [Candidatus Omnitrophica bacterium]|nr:hypothetical protein [Candidatus Omnitrophota bacterium]